MTLEPDTVVEVLIELDEVSIELDEDDAPTWEVTRKQEPVPRSPLSKDPTAEEVPRLLRAKRRQDREVTRKQPCSSRD